MKAVAGVAGTRARAERLTRYVNALLDKKPTVSLPSALEVLRTKVGDCNEHTALYVAMARSIGIPARIAVGLTYVRGITGVVVQLGPFGGAHPAGPLLYPYVIAYLIAVGCAADRIFRRADL